MDGGDPARTLRHDEGATAPLLELHQPVRCSNVTTAIHGPGGSNCAMPIDACRAICLAMRDACGMPDGAVFSNDLLLEPLTSRGRHGIITHLQGTLRQDDELIPKPRPPKFDAQAEAKTEAELLRKLQEQQPTTLAGAMLQTRYAQVITEMDAPYRIVAVNREWCDTCGFSSEEAIGETCGMLQGPGTCKNTLHEISKACEVTPLPLSPPRDPRAPSPTLVRTPPPLPETWVRPPLRRGVQGGVGVDEPWP